MNLQDPTSLLLTTPEGADVEILRLGDPEARPRFVLFHAAVTGAHTLVPLARELLAEGGAAWSVNLPGYGRSTASSTITDISAQISAAATVLDHLGADSDPVHLFGHSFGGLIASRTALNRPAAVRRLSLFEPIVFSVLTFGDAEDLAARNEDRVLIDAIIAAKDGNAEPALAAFVNYWNDTPWSDLPKPARDHFVATVGHMAADLLAVRSDQDVETDYSPVTVPTDLLLGEHTTAPAIRTVGRLAQIIRGARRIELAGLGHMAPLLAPKKVANLLIQTP
jgi:pimeloyl-ACP methyl ester carboxylesterase